MKQGTKLQVLLAVSTLVLANSLETNAASMGTIRGFVKDAQGKPLPGAAVLVVAEPDRVIVPERGAAEKNRIIKKANTDNEGKFVATGIVPGRYRIKAAAEGFNSVELDALVKPNKVTVFDSILLRRVGTLAEETRRNVDSKYAARSYPGTIFHAGETDLEPKQSTEVLATLTRETHGFLHAYSQSEIGAAPGGVGALTGVNFAVSQGFGSMANLVISGQGGIGDSSPQRLEALATAHVGERHQVAVALGYGRFTLSRREAPHSLAQYTVSATDTWQVSGPVLVVYGLEASRFSSLGSSTTILPRFGFAFDAGPTTRLMGGMVPGSSSDEQSRVSLESGEISFQQTKPLAVTPMGQPIADKSYRLQFGGEQILSDNSSLEL